ncbi:MAG: hypothetical protein A3F84_19985 [Candidatus Handelsmanbacteria bacterium RIFCSPLOWO2_12_FULL_64_10]|uniref:Nudix hydrolase domain-containing protein n=1 Tax=Handelsmanbacteria sp. (strain RIFCSPLOWO2_12_FULL_64_10) TaxID=1817868 RepID=A0A1F6C8X6_HANXR|nr:MAG: hypothetical protein A3F84_19985 [Candidatus Handelsmanbacteria bacterium RIFCSPLOWO2_12_FULL_64_10]
MSEVADLVDEDDRVIGGAPRGEIRAGNLLHRGVGILVRDPRGRIYVHRRTDTKDVFPGAYDMFVGGMVGAGEAYEAAAAREVAEELGVRGGLRFLFKHRYRGPRNNAWVAMYEVEWDGPIVHQPEEIAWGAWMTPDEILGRLGDWTWVEDGLEIFHEARRRGTL